MESTPLEGYETFLTTFDNGIKITFILLSIFYIYSLVSYFLYAKSVKNMKIMADTLVINFAYFFIVTIEYFFKNNHTINYDILSFAFVPIIIYVALYGYKTKLYIHSYKDIFFKILTLVMIAFFIINSKYLILSFQLIIKDINNNIVNKISILSKQEKEKIITTLQRKVNDKTLSKVE